MNRWVTVLCIMLFAAIGSVYSINITGKVTSNSGSAIQGAIVSLLTNQLKDTTDQNGNFTLSDGQVGVLPRQMVPFAEALTMNNGILHFGITERKPVKVELFDVRGNLVRRIINHILPAGNYRYDIASSPVASQMLAVRVQVGLNGTTFKYMPMGNRYAWGGGAGLKAVGSELNALAKIQATVDSVKVQATGYMPKSVAVETLEGRVNITLETMQALDKFSFFVTSLAALQDLSGSEDGFGGDLRFGHTGPGAGLKGADSICECIAERSMPGSKVKQWRAFLSVKADENGQQVNAIDRIGEGPWYDRVGRLLAPTRADLLNTRPQNGDPAIMNDLPNEDGIPNHRPDPNLPEVDNHHFVTGSGTDGKLYSANATCNDWTSSIANSGKPRAGFSWPRNMGGGMGGNNGSHWISGFDAGGCLPGIHITSDFGGANDIIGAQGGYGGFYCFALTP